MPVGQRVVPVLGWFVGDHRQFQYPPVDGVGSQRQRRVLERVRLDTAPVGLDHLRCYLGKLASGSERVERVEHLRGDADTRGCGLVCQLLWPRDQRLPVGGCKVQCPRVLVPELPLDRRGQLECKEQMLRIACRPEQIQRATGQKRVVLEIAIYLHHTVRVAPAEGGAVP